MEALLPIGAVIGGLVLLVLLIRWAKGDFRSCAECGSHRTVLKEEFVHDFSGRNHVHEWRWQHCHACGHNETFKGITVTAT